MYVGQMLVTRKDFEEESCTAVILLFSLPIFVEVKPGNLAAGVAQLNVLAEQR